MDYFRTFAELTAEYGYNPAQARDSDVVWFDTLDNNLTVATTAMINELTPETVGLKDKKVICRAIDMDVWAGHYRNVDWSFVDDLIFIAPHIQKVVTDEVDFSKFKTKIHMIPCGVDVDKFNFNIPPNPRGYNIAWVAERWFAKGIDYFLQFAAMLYKKDPQYKIYAVGRWADNAESGWYRAYIDSFIAKNKMNVEFIDIVEDMNKFLEEMSYAICFSKKEAFSYVIAEGMCKGLKPIIHNFYGAEAIWDKQYIWNTIDEAIEMVTGGDYTPYIYRKYIEENYPIKLMLERIYNVIKS